MWRSQSALTREPSDASFEISLCSVRSETESFACGIVTDLHMSVIIVVNRPRALADLNCALFSRFVSMSSSAFRDSWLQNSGIEISALEISATILSRSRSAWEILVDNDF